MKILCLNPFFVHFVVLVYVLKTVQKQIQSGTEAVGGHGESKDEGIVFVKLGPNTNEVCKENSKKKNIFYLYLTCVVKISCRKFSFTPNSFFFVHFGLVLLLNYFIVFFN